MNTAWISAHSSLYNSRNEQRLAYSNREQTSSLDRSTRALTNAAVGHVGLFLVLVLDTTRNARCFRVPTELLELLHGIGTVVSDPVVRIDILELVGTPLPFATDFDSHLDAAVHLLGTTLIVDTELKDIAILGVSSPLFSTHFQAVWPRRRVRVGQTNVVQE